MSNTRRGFLSLLMACMLIGQHPAASQAHERQTSISRVLTNEDYLALTIWGEARGLSIYHYYAVGSVILNRVFSSKYPNTIKEVVLQPHQFSVWNRKNPNYLKMLAVAQGRWPHPADELAYLQARRVAAELLKTGPTIKATSFHSRGGKHTYY